MKKFLCLLCLSATVAHADTTLKYTSTTDGASLIQLIDGKVHMKTLGEENVSMIFDKNTGTFISLMHDQKQYISFGPKEIEALGNMAAVMQAEMEKQLAQMPEAQREQMREMMMGMMKDRMPKQAPPPTYTKTGVEKSFNGFDCEIVVKTSNNKESGDFCVTSYKDLGISQAEYDSIAGLMKVAEKMASQFGQDDSMNFSALGQYVPVQYNMSHGTGTLESVSHKTIDRAVFSVPEGYSKQELGLDALQ